MAKMFYTLEETAEVLGKSQDEVKAMVTSGQLKEFRDPEKGLIFKKEQVDLLAGTDDDHIPLAEDKHGSGLALSLEDSGPGGGSGSGISLDEGAKEKSGISIFDTDDLESADPSAVTQVSATGAQELTMESVGSGSGLLDLTREGDDTSLGADLLEDVYQGEDGTTEGDTQAASGLFETTSAASDVSSGVIAAGGPVMLTAAEVYDGPGSGLGGGLALGTIIVLLFAIAAALLGIIGAGSNPVVDLVSSNLYMWLGIFAAIILVLGVVGWLVGKKS